MKKQKIIKELKSIIETATLKNTDEKLFANINHAKLWAYSWLELPLRNILKEIENK